MYNSFIFLNKMPKNLLILTSQYSPFIYIFSKIAIYRGKLYTDFYIIYIYKVFNLYLLKY